MVATLFGDNCHDMVAEVLIPASLYLARPTHVCNGSVLGPLLVMEGADQADSASIEVFAIVIHGIKAPVLDNLFYFLLVNQKSSHLRGIIQTEGIIFHKVVFLAHGSLQNLGRMVHKLDEFR